MEAPRVVAKGVDNVALRIRAVAEEHGVAIVENPPVARALHASVEIDQEIPPAHYKAVAELIGYVLRLNRGLPGRRPRSPYGRGCAFLRYVLAPWPLLVTAFRLTPRSTAYPTGARGKPAV